MKLGMHVGFVPGHIVLDGDPAPPTPKGHSPPTFGPYPLRQNGCIHHDSTWYGGSLHHGAAVLDGDPAPLRPKRGRTPKFSAHVYCGQTAGWIKMVLGMEVGRSPGDLVVLDVDPAPSAIFGPFLL